VYVQGVVRMSIGSEVDMQSLKECGRIVALALQEMARHLKPGITTLELDRIGEAFLTRHGARSAPRLAYDFPGGTCISINDEAAHGIPGKRVVQEGDLVNLDVSADLNGFVADTGATFAVPPVSPTKEKLLRCTRAALNKAIAAAQAGRPMNVIGQAVETEAKRCKFSIIANLAGHGVGRSIHEEPREVLNYYDPRDRRKLTEGMVITIEPFLSTGAPYVLEDPDGWTLKTPDGSLSCQYEHTIVITRGKPLIITAA
jgi:methionyl aminopeptidase